MRRKLQERSPRRRGRLVCIVAAAAAPGLYALFIRPRILTWGATQDEVGANYPGDELVPDATSGATMATTLPAPAERVWPWLVQMGAGRAGWYSWDWLDNKRVRSADRIVPEWQNVEVGHRLSGPTNWWTVMVLEPKRTLVLRSSYSLLSGNSFDPATGPVPWAYEDGIWGFHLRAAPGDDTRLVIRTRSRSHPLALTRPSAFWSGSPCTSSCKPARSAI